MPSIRKRQGTYSYFPSSRKRYSSYRSSRRSTPYRRKRYTKKKKYTKYKSYRGTRSKKPRRKSAKSISPRFRMYANNIALPYVKDNYVYIAYVGRAGSVYFKKFYLANVQFYKASDFDMILVKHSGIKKDLIKYGQYYGKNAKVVCYFPPAKNDSAKVTRVTSVDLSTYMTMVTNYIGMMKTRFLADDGFTIQELKTGVPENPQYSPVRFPDINRVPGTPSPSRTG